MKRIVRGLVVPVLIACSFAHCARAQIKGLRAERPAPEYADKMMLFGQFVGDWDVDVVTVRPGGTRVKGKAEWHFAWALDGRAIQDVFIARDDVSKANAPISEWGTTLRFYDPKADAWRVAWIGPRRGNLLAFVAKNSGSEIVMELDYMQGLPRLNEPDRAAVHRAEWIFDDIKADSFHWRASTSHDGGKRWQMQSEMFARRTKAETRAEKQSGGGQTTTDEDQPSKDVRDTMKSSPATGSGSTREEQNSRTILEVFRAIEERNQEQFVSHVQPDFEIHWPASLPYGGTFRGLQPRPNGWSEIWEPLQPTPAERQMNAQVVAARGDEVVVLWHQRGLSPSGERFDQEVVGMYRFREGKLARAQMFYFDTAAVARFLGQAQGSSRHDR